MFIYPPHLLTDYQLTTAVAVSVVSRSSSSSYIQLVVLGWMVIPNITDNQPAYKTITRRAQTPANNYTLLLKNKKKIQTKMH